MEDDLKRKRPDRALALKRQKLLNNHVIKATLSGVVSNQTLKNEIESLVIYASKLHKKVLHS